MIFMIIVFTAISLFSHEVSFNYSSLEEQQNPYSVHKGWKLNFAALRWGNNDFSDYALSVLFTQYGPTLRTDLDLAWLRLKIIKDLEFRLGKQYSDFGAVEGSGSCCGGGSQGFGGAESVSIYSFQHSPMFSSYMLKLIYDFRILEARAFWAHDFAEEMDAGLRISFDLSSLKLGGTMIWEDFEHDNEKLHYDLDAQYNLLDLFDLAVQASIVDDGIETTDDLLAFGKISYIKGVELPVIGKIIPYTGIDSFQSNKERISLIGLNLTPIPNSFIKAEYRTNTDKDFADMLEFQVGYVF